MICLYVWLLLGLLGFAVCLVVSNLLTDVYCLCWLGRFVCTVLCVLT